MHLVVTLWLKQAPQKFHLAALYWSDCQYVALLMKHLITYTFHSLEVLPHMGSILGVPPAHKLEGTGL